MRLQTVVYRAILILALSLLLALPAVPRAVRAAGPWYVAAGGSDTNTCLSPAAPCATINGALGKASSGDTIYVASGMYIGSGTEVVSINKDVTLSGGWNGSFTAHIGSSVIDGEGSRMGIMLAENSNAALTVEGFTIQNGMTGIYVPGGSVVTLNEGIVRGNTYSGIYGIGRVTVYRSTISGNGNATIYIYGGGINAVDLTLIDSTVSANTARDGGGIYAGSGTVTLRNSSVHNNTATGGGGGLYVYGLLDLTNSTVSRNTANGPGGGILCYGTLLLNSSTISENKGASGGGFANDSGPGTLQNTIVANNQARLNEGPDCYAPYVHSAGFNLLTVGCLATSGTGDLLNMQPEMINLGDYYALARSSPAIDAGNPAGCTDSAAHILTTDQRGVARVGRCDIGAYEYEPNNDPLGYGFLPLVRR